MKGNRRKSGLKDEETFKTWWDVNLCFKLADPYLVAHILVKSCVCNFSFGCDSKSTLEGRKELDAVVRRKGTSYNREFTLE